MVQTIEFSGKLIHHVLGSVPEIKGGGHHLSAFQFWPSLWCCVGAGVTHKAILVCKPDGVRLCSSLFSTRLNIIEYKLIIGSLLEVQAD